MSESVPLSVVVPTIGRVAQLETTLQSLVACDPRADEVVVVDQSPGPEIDAVVARFAGAGARRVPCAGRGIGLALNVGLRAAGHDQVAVTHDDCTVAGDWIAAARAQLAVVPTASSRALSCPSETRRPSPRRSTTPSRTTTPARSTTARCSATT